MSQSHRKLNYQFHRGNQLLGAHHVPTNLTGALTIVDMEAATPPRGDQGAEGSCTSWGVLEAIRTVMRLLNAGADLGPFAHQAAYWWARKRRGNQAHDTGSSVTDELWAAMMYGLALDPAWPYSMRFDQEPSQAAYASAKQHRLLPVHAAPLMKDMAHVWGTLNDMHTVPFGFNVYTSFMDSMTEKTGIWKGPVKGDKLEGGHCMYLCGYNPQTRMFKAPNSWGLDWGIRGCVWIAQDFLMSNEADDFHAIVGAPPIAAAAVA